VQQCEGYVNSDVSVVIFGTERRADCGVLTGGRFLQASSCFAVLKSNNLFSGVSKIVERGTSWRREERKCPGAV